jgi:hypothetical protein
VGPEQSPISRASILHRLSGTSSHQGSKLTKSSALLVAFWKPFRASFVPPAGATSFLLPFHLSLFQARAAASLEELRRRSAVAAKELAEQVERSKRAQKRGDKLRREHREKAGFQGGQGLTQVEQEIKLTEVRESNREVLQELKQLCADNLTAVAFVEAALGEARLKLPSGSTPAGSRGSSRQGSIAGSLASVNTSRSSLASRNSNTSIGSARSSVSKSASVKNVKLDLPVR